ISAADISVAGSTLVWASAITDVTTNTADRKATILIALITVSFSLVENGGTINVLYAECAEVSIGQARLGTHVVTKLLAFHLTSRPDALILSPQNAGQRIICEGGNKNGRDIQSR